MYNWVAEAGRARGHRCIRFCMFLEPTDYPVTYLYVIENVYYFLVLRFVECQCLEVFFFFFFFFCLRVSYLSRVNGFSAIFLLSTH